MLICKITCKLNGMGYVGKTTRSQKKKFPNGYNLTDGGEGIFSRTIRANFQQQ